MDDSLRILFVGINNVDLIYNAIKDFGYEVQPGYLNTINDVPYHLCRTQWDILIFIAENGDLDFDNSIKKLLNFEIDIPIILIHMRLKQDKILKALDMGFDDALSIDELDRLGYIIYRTLQTKKRDKTKQQNLDLTFDAAPIGMLLVDENAIIKKINKSMLNIAGIRKEEAINKSIKDSLGFIDSYKDEGPNLGEILTNASMIKQTIPGVEAQFTLLVGGKKENRWLKFSSVPLKMGGRRHTILVIDDITKTKMAEESLKRYQLLSENVNDIIMFSHINGKIIEANNAALVAYGYTREEIMGRSIFELARPNNKSIVRTQSHNAKGIYYEAVALKKDGNKFFVEANLQSAIIGQSRVLLSIQRDITERKKTHEKLEKARIHSESANRAKSEFLANMSHEIRTPLNGMLGMIDLTLLTDLTEEQNDNLLIAKSCASNLLNLINDILDFSRMEARKLHLENISFDLRNLIDKTAKTHGMKALEKGLNLFYHIDFRIPQYVNGDPNRLKQVLNNILGNAVKFTHKGRISLSVDLKDNKDEYIELEFKISDTGIGIEARDMERIFGTFSQVDSSTTKKYGGSGLGLAISKQLVEMMGGSIWAESGKEGGSIFYFTIKLTTGDPVSMDIIDDIKGITQSEKSLNILLAEDDKASQIVIARMLKEAGHFVHIANNGIEVLDIIDKRAIDLILMDIQMPRMNGIEAVKRIRKDEKYTDKHIPIIALTAYALKGDREKFIAAGMDDYISKPVEIGTLLEAILKVAENSEMKRWDKEYNDYRNHEYENLTLKYDGDMEGAIKDIETNIMFLKKSFEDKDLNLIERYANDIRQICIDTNMDEMKENIFKLELAIRREDMREALERFNQAVKEFESIKGNMD